MRTIDEKQIKAIKYLIEQLSMEQIGNLTKAEELLKHKIEVVREHKAEEKKQIEIAKQIEKIENELEVKEKKIEKDEEVLEEKNEELKLRAEKIKIDEEKLKARNRLISGKEKEIDDKLEIINKKEKEAENGFKDIQEKIIEEYKEKIAELKSNTENEKNKLEVIEKEVKKKEEENKNFLDKILGREKELELLQENLKLKEKEIEEKELESLIKIEDERNECIKEIEDIRKDTLKKTGEEIENLKSKEREMNEEISNLEMEIENKRQAAVKEVQTLASELTTSKLEEVEIEVQLIREEKLEAINEEINELKDKQNNEFKERDKEFANKEKEYCEREKILIQREYEAENGFRKKNEEALKSLKEIEKEIKKEIEDILKEKEITKLQVQDELSEFRKLKEKNIEKELEDYKNSSIELIDKTKKDIESWREEELLKIEASKLELENAKNCLQIGEKELNSKTRECEKIKKELAESQEDLEDDEEDLKDSKKRFEEKVRVEAGIMLSEKENEIVVLNTQIEELREIVTKLQDEVNHYKLIHSRSGNRTSEELLGEMKILNERNIELEKNLAKRPNHDRVVELEAKLEALKKAKSERDELLCEVQVLREDNNSKYILENELKSKALALETIESNIETLHLEKIALDEEISKFRKLYDQVDKIEARVEAIEKPRFEELPQAIEVDDMTEKEWLDKILSDCEKSGFIFSKRLLYAFHTALKTANWSIITVLLGVSGTGKSKLPELYARFGGMYFELLSVGPDWQDEIPLFGYYNSIDNRYNATELLRAMVQFSGKSKVNDLSDYMYLVLLDEMNLAHVEEYFKDMLSKLEAKRGKKADEEVVINIDQGAGAEKYKLPLTDNVLWIGTMNEDETTKSLSDKVIDRGQLISFPKPNKFASIELTDGETKTFAPANRKLKKTMWEKWQKRNVLGHEYFKEKKEEYKVALEKVNMLLERAGITLGHRVWQSIEGYMAYHVEVTELMLDADGINIPKKKLEIRKVNQKLTEAFEEAIVHKVMPKLRGIANNGNTRTEVIDRIRTIFIDEEFAPGLLRDFDFATREENEVFLWKSASYLEVQSEEENK